MSGVPVMVEIDYLFIMLPLQFDAPETRVVSLSHYNDTAATSILTFLLSTARQSVSSNLLESSRFDLAGE